MGNAMTPYPSNIVRGAATNWRRMMTPTKGQLTITIPFELEKLDHVNDVWPPEEGEQYIDSYMLSSLLIEIKKNGNIPLIYSSGYFHGEIFFTEARLVSIEHQQE